ncbi:glycerol-3-phosphate acyltransferase [candidate division WOR-3 bacterium]|nr:glycerol-3-phosphate acyltransferase [candidate division WOR-3 bacterium]
MNAELLNSIIWTAAGFASGSLMISFWMGKFFLKEDIREYGDRNPGATNAWKAGGWKIGLPSGLLEFAKGGAPVAVAVWVFGVEGWYLVPVALAPILGHAFSPFMKFKGGKAIAVTLGVWTAITVWEGLLVLGLLIGLAYIILNHPSWSLIFAMLVFLAYLVVVGLLGRGVAFPILAVWAGNMGTFLIKHFQDLREPLKTRDYIARIFRKAS